MRIVETEAYRGEEDEGCHAHRGRTKRTENLYRPGGFAYVYMVYGLHFLLNVVTGKPEEPQAALIRACLPPDNGPGKLTKRLGVTLAQNGLWLPDSEELWLEDDGLRPAVTTAPRVGIDYAGEAWRLMPWRFIGGEV